MKFSVGQMVLCYRTNDVRNHMLVGAVGEIREIADPLVAFFFQSDYIVYFPAFPSGKCPHCSEHHDPLLFALAENELRPVDDPDQGKVEETNEDKPITSQAPWEKA